MSSMATGPGRCASLGSYRHCAHKDPTSCPFAASSPRFSCWPPCPPPRSRRPTRHPRRWLCRHRPSRPSGLHRQLQPYLLHRHRWRDIRFPDPDHLAQLRPGYRDQGRRVARPWPCHARQLIPPRLRPRFSIMSRIFALAAILAALASAPALAQDADASAPCDPTSDTASCPAPDSTEINLAP